jgi:hypothetical protein
VEFAFRSGAEDGTHDVYEYIPGTGISGWGEDLAPQIIAAYRAGTLPADLMAGDDQDDWRLKIVEVGEDEPKNIPSFRDVRGILKRDDTDGSEAD